MILPAVLIVPRSLNPDGGVPTDQDCAVWNTTFRACPPGGSLCLVWADGTIACTRKLPDGMWTAAGRSEPGQAAA